MSYLSFHQTHQNAIREMARLVGIKKNLASLIVDLKHSHPDSIWIRIYEERLQENVLPAIKEVQDYISHQELIVTKTSN